MDKVKVEIDEDNLSYDNSCFICLQAVPLNVSSYVQMNSTNLFFNYLKVSSETDTFVCAKCGKSLAKFGKLLDILEKTRLKIDQLLDSIKCAISNSNNVKPLDYGLASTRETVVQKCLDKLRSNPQVIMERIDNSEGLKDEGSQDPTPDVDDDWLPNWDSGLITGDLEDNEGSPVTPEANLEDGPPKKKRRRSTQRNPKCPKCSKTFSSMSELRRHEKSIHLLLKPFKCTKCPKTFASSWHLKQHDQIFHLQLKQFKCSTCQKSFSQKVSLRTHINTVHLNIRPHMCEMCGKSFPREQDLRIHRSRPHDSKPNSRASKDLGGKGRPCDLVTKPFTCSTCQKSFTQKATLQHHINTVHLNIRPHMCDMCGKSFYTEKELKRHRAVPHDPKPQNPNAKAFPCEICEKTFDTKGSWSRHVKAHSGKVFPCPICSKKFAQRSNMTLHVARVHENKRSQCQAPGCNKSYLSSYLVTHYRLEHPDFTVPEKPKIVTQISSEFTLKIENEKRLVECNLCGDQLKDARLLKEHQGRVHGINKFLCAECGFSTPYKHGLRKHVERKHSMNHSGENVNFN